MGLPSLRAYPCPTRKSTLIRESFGRVYVPGTTRKYDRARNCCVHVAGFSCPGHCATDIVVPSGTDVVAVWDGWLRLEKVPRGNTAFGLQCTVVARGTNVGAFYAHLSWMPSTLLAEDGQLVRAGQRIGKVGSSGQTSGPHLHFELRERWDDWCSARPSYPQLERLRRAV